MAGHGDSIWLRDTRLPGFPTLDELADPDVLVIGGGIAGLTTALLLQREGWRTAVLEQHRIGKGETLRTTAHLTEFPDVGFARLVADFGGEQAKLVASSQRDAVALIAALAREAPCEFERVDGYLYAEPGGDRERLAREHDAARQLGVEAELLDRAPLPFPTAGAVRFPGQAQFHPGRYLAGLVRLYAEAGGLISEETRVEGIDEDAEGCRVRTGRAIMHARHVVAVTDAPVGGGPLLDTRLRANRSYALAARVQGAALPAGLFWDTEDPYHYIRAATADGQPVLIVGGEDHRTGTTGEGEAMERLRQFVEERFPVRDVVCAWSGQILEPVDGLPYIGRRQDGSRVLLATGFAGNGLTFATAGARLLAALVGGEERADAALYSPSRPLGARQWAKYAAQNLPAAWTLVSDLLPHVRAGSVDELAPGEGVVGRIGGRHVAAARDRDGVLHVVSPTCPHMGCDVAWNAFEQTWDCPCHGSRFEASGRLVHGPATRGLEPLPATRDPGRESPR